MAGPHEGWVSFWDEQASQQSEERIRHIAEKVSRTLKAPLIAFLIHDSDFLCYWMYETGELLDVFNSFPSYWDDAEIEEEPLRANVAEFARICRPGTKPELLHELLMQHTREARATGELCAFPIAEDRLTELATLLGLREDILLSDFASIGRSISAKELGARWIGTGEPPLVCDEPVEGEVEQRQFLKKAPLHAAAEQNDVAAIKRLVAAGRDINEMPSGFQVTALAMAAALGSPPTIKALVEMGADLHKKGREGMSPIRCAVQSSKIGNLRVLVELGADIGDYDLARGTLLHLAVAMQGSPELIRTLLELGSDANRLDEIGLRPIDNVRGTIQAQEHLRSLLGSSSQHTHRLDEQLRKLTEIERLLDGRYS